MDTLRNVVPAAEEVIDRYFKVLDFGFVALKDYMGSDLAVEESARVSYGGGTRKMSDTRTLLRYLFRNRHTSPFEMTELRFHIGLPIFVMRQLVRHRTANLNEYSGRYSLMPMMFYTPDQDKVCGQSKKNRQGRQGAVPLSEEDYGQYWLKTQTQRGMAARNYREWVDELDIAREIARIDLPLSTYTFCYWKCDLRNLFNFMGLRSDPHAQWEIQAFSDVICGIVQRLCPLSFEAFQDYQQTAVTFSQVEMQAIRLVAAHHVSPIAWENPPDFVKGPVDTLMTDYGCTGREVAEFWDKLKVRGKRDFSLDVASSQSGEYFMKLVQDHAVEVPAT